MELRKASENSHVEKYGKVIAEPKETDKMSEKDIFKNSTLRCGMP